MSCQYNKNIFSTFSTIVSDGEFKFSLELWDTSGQDCVASGSLDNIGEANVYIICFALDRLDSFNNARNKWYSEVQRLGLGAPVMLIGTKCDLRENKSAFRVMITPEMGEQLEEEIKAFAYIECSALKRLRLDVVFEESVRSALSAPSPPSPPPSHNAPDKSKGTSHSLLILLL